MTSFPDDGAAPIARARALTLHNSGYWFAGFLVITLVAFWPPYFAKLPARMDIYTHVHAALMTVWFGLLIAQPFLIRRGWRGWHRALGRFSYVLVPAIAITWVQLVHVRARAMPDDVFAKEGKFFYLAFVSAVLFLSAWGMAILRRRTPPLHARYMVCTAFALIDAVMARLLFFNFPTFENPFVYQAIGFGLTEAIIAVLLLIDRGPHRRAFAHMLILFGALHAFWFTGAQTNMWLEAVRWFRGLPLT
ncbi:MAG: hypothetical protein ACXW5U_27940 [Thermoanaerobaculia bacterium]